MRTRTRSLSRTRGRTRTRTLLHGLLLGLLLGGAGLLPATAARAADNGTWGCSRRPRRVRR